MLLANKYDLISDNDCKELCEWDVKYDALTLTIGWCRNIERLLKNHSIPFEIADLCCKYFGEEMIGETYAKDNGMLYFDVSAKTGYNINEAFDRLSVRAYEYHCKYNQSVILYDEYETPKRSVGCW